MRGNYRKCQKLFLYNVDIYQEICMYLFIRTKKNITQKRKCKSKIIITLQEQQNLACFKQNVRLFFFNFTNSTQCDQVKKILQLNLRKNAKYDF